MRLTPPPPPLSLYYMQKVEVVSRSCWVQCPVTQVRSSEICRCFPCPSFTEWLLHGHYLEKFFWRWLERCVMLRNMLRAQWRNLRQSGNHAESGRSLSLPLLSLVQPWPSEVGFKGTGAHLGPSLRLYF